MSTHSKSDNIKRCLTHKNSSLFSVGDFKELKFYKTKYSINLDPFKMVLPFSYPDFSYKNTILLNNMYHTFIRIIQGTNISLKGSQFELYFFLSPFYLNQEPVSTSSTYLGDNFKNRDELIKSLTKLKSQDLNAEYIKIVDNMLNYLLKPKAVLSETSFNMQVTRVKSKMIWDAYHNFNFKSKFEIESLTEYQNGREFIPFKLETIPDLKNKTCDELKTYHKIHNYTFYIYNFDTNSIYKIDELYMKIYILHFTDVTHFTFKDITDNDNYVIVSNGTRSENSREINFKINNLNYSICVYNDKCEYSNSQALRGSYTTNIYSGKYNDEIKKYYLKKFVRIGKNITINDLLSLISFNIRKSYVFYSLSDQDYYLYNRCIYNTSTLKLISHPQINYISDEQDYILMFKESNIIYPILTVELKCIIRSREEAQLDDSIYKNNLRKISAILKGYYLTKQALKELDKPYEDCPKNILNWNDYKNYCWNNMKSMFYNATTNYIYDLDDVIYENNQNFEFIHSIMPID